MTDGVSPRDDPGLSEATPLLDPTRSYELLVKAVVDYAIFMIGVDGRIVSWNAGAERIKGYTADEIVGRHFSVFFTEPDREAGEPQRILARAADTGRTETEGRRVRKDGSQFWALAVVDAIRDESGKLLGYAKVTRDVTERREAAKRLEEARKQLFESQKMEALGQFTGGMAHDFNNLLTAVLSGVQLAVRHIDDRDRVLRLLESTRSAAQRGAGITKQLLAFARRQPLEPKVIDVIQQLNDAIPLLKQSLRGDIEFITELPVNLWKVEVDPSQFDLALLNVVVNARDAMPNGGRIRLKAENTAMQGKIAGLDGEFVVIEISDTGSGIPEEIRDRIFEPFFTTKTFGQGTGLGLSQVYGFVKQSKGAVTVDSAPGRGTTIRMFLPVSHTEASRSGSSIPHPRGRVLLVEDDPTVASLGSELVIDLGYEVHVVHSADEALTMLEHDRRFSLVFSDVIMPGGMSGLELARQIRLRLPELPILLTTGYSDQALGKRHEFPVLPKPYELEDLSTAFSKLVGTLEPAP